MIPSQAMNKTCFLCNLTVSCPSEMVLLLCDHNLCMVCAGKRLRLQKSSGRHEATCSLCGEHSSLSSDIVAAIRIHNSQNKLSSLLSPKGVQSPSLPAKPRQVGGGNSAVEKPRTKEQRREDALSNLEGRESQGNIRSSASTKYSSSVITDRVIEGLNLKGELSSDSKIGNSFLRKMKEKISVAGKKEEKKSSSKDTSVVIQDQNSLKKSRNDPSGKTGKSLTGCCQPQLPNSQSFTSSSSSTNASQPNDLHLSGTNCNGETKNQEIMGVPGMPASKSQARLAQFSKTSIQSPKNSMRPPTGQVHGEQNASKEKMMKSSKISESFFEGVNSSSKPISGLDHNQSTSEQKKERTWSKESKSQVDSEQKSHPKKENDQCPIGHLLNTAIEASLRDVKIMIHEVKQLKHCIEEAKNLLEQIDACWTQVTQKTQFTSLKKRLLEYFTVYKGIGLIMAKDQLRNLIMPLQIESLNLLKTNFNKQKHEPEPIGLGKGNLDWEEPKQAKEQIMSIEEIKESEEQLREILAEKRASEVEEEESKMMSLSKYKIEKWDFKGENMKKRTKSPSEVLIPSIFLTFPPFFVVMFMRFLGYMKNFLESSLEI